MKIIMLGAPGAGKGTQAVKLSEKYCIPHISTGDILRTNIKSGTELGKRVKAFLDNGQLVPDELVIDLTIDRVKRDDCKRGYILDGFPRTIPQAQEFESALENDGEKIDYIIDIEVPDENIIQRMSGRRTCSHCGATYHILHNPTKIEEICDSCGKRIELRDDDKPETIKKRLVVYHEQTQPLMDYYTIKGNLVKIDGTLGIDEIFNSIVEILGE